MGEVYLDFWTFPFSLFGGFFLEQWGLCVAGSLFWDLDWEWSLVRMGMVLIDILEFRGCCCVGIVPEVNFFT